MLADLDRIKPQLSKWKILIITLIIGLSVRLCLIPITSSPFDVAAGWIAVIEEIYAGNSLYDAELYKYTPIWGYILAFISAIANLLGMESFGEMFTTIYPGQELTFGYGFISNLGFNTLVKTPALIFDLLTVLSVYKLVKDITGNHKKAEISAAMWFLCPVVIISSAVFAMFDSIMIFFMVESIYYFRKKKWAFTGILMALSILTKAFSAVLLPIMIAYMLSERENSWMTRAKNIGFATVGFVTTTLLIYAMPLITGEFEDSIWFLTSRSNTYASGGGLNILDVGFNNIFFYMPAIIAILLASTLIMAVKKTNRDDVFLTLSIIVLSVMFCFPYVSYTPTYGIVLVLPTILLYVKYGKIAIMPWALTLFFVIHGIAHYWETMFYPLAAFTNLVNITDIVENMGNGKAYRTILLWMSSSGFAIMVITIVKNLLDPLKIILRRCKSLLP